MSRLIPKNRARLKLRKRDFVSQKNNFEIFVARPEINSKSNKCLDSLSENVPSMLLLNQNSEKINPENLHNLRLIRTLAI